MKDEIIQLLTSVHEAALATLQDGRPYASAVGYLYNEERLYLLLSQLANHTKNLEKNPEASLLVVENSKSPIHEKKRVTLTGKVNRAGTEQREILKEKYLRIFPKSEIFFSLPDFHFYEFKISEAYWIGGFGKATTLGW